METYTNRKADVQSLKETLLKASTITCTIMNNINDLKRSDEYNLGEVWNEEMKQREIKLSKSVFYSIEKLRKQLNKLV